MEHTRVVPGFTIDVQQQEPAAATLGSWCLTAFFLRPQQAVNCHLVRAVNPGCMVLGLDPRW